MRRKIGLLRRVGFYRVSVFFQVEENESFYAVQVRFIYARFQNHLTICK